MELTFIGLGRMGNAMVNNLAEQGFTIHGYDTSAEARALAPSSISVHESLAEAVAAQVTDTRIVWLMVPSSYVDSVLEELIPVLAEGDTIIDGGNSFYQDSLRRYTELKEKGIHFIDCGVSGGMEGARTGASVMVGGNTDTVMKYEALFTALATENGFAHVGGPGAGHFVKMVHNGIEYGMMSALAEGMQVIESHAAQFNIDTMQVLDPYEYGSIISSSLMSWLAEAYRTPGYLDAIAGTVPTGETETEMEHLATIHPFPTLDTALTVRKETRSNPSRVGTLISAMRNQFGGHKTVAKDGDTT